MLTSSTTTSECPYKGDAHDYSLNASENSQDLVWYYENPLPEAFDVCEKLCFYSEKVDEFYIDGEKQPK